MAATGMCGGLESLLSWECRLRSALRYRCVQYAAAPPPSLMRRILSLGTMEAQKVLRGVVV